jgi:hypothetical protein
LCDKLDKIASNRSMVHRKIEIKEGDDVELSLDQG